MASSAEASSVALAFSRWISRTGSIFASAGTSREVISSPIAWWSSNEAETIRLLVFSSAAMTTGTSVGPLRR